MKKTTKVFAALAGTILALSLASCNEKKTAATGSHEKVTIKFPTAGASGALYAVGAAITNLWDTQIDFVSASSQASNGGIDNLNQIADGESQVSIAISSNCYQSFNGTDSFKGNANKNLRVIAGLYFNPNQVVATKKSGIEQVADVKGKHFAVAAAGSSVEGECKNHFTAAGINYPADIQAEYIAFGDAADMLQNGTIDGAWIMSGAPAAAVSQACSAGCHLVNISDDVIASLQKDYPWYAKFTIPAGTYPGQDADIQTSAIKMVMFTSTSLDEETVYQLTKTLWEHIEELGQAQKNLKGLTPEAAVVDIAGLPLHDGAAKYYKEAGIIK
ncbi:MAG: TAXI family TRAP transporter solute-binding subunit [Treponema sp.]|uniref:TAXI family TRAP transporter solute-binding subunit n=1 Tax=Treponema sp. TaxID=166 RepID=UPI002A9095D7|nr:TAXI family TRAP transporter solute-binding subunit [Treponema sp.]MDY6398149.1 TAXI family TRAP transporter solute-binding subunit [Treponema sp.]